MNSELGALIDLASKLFAVPIALVSLVEQNRQVFAASVGVEIGETERELSFCTHALVGPELLVVPDATLDPRFFDHPMVCGGPNLRFYAGAPLISPGGHVLGTLCLVDVKPHNGFSGSDRETLHELAALVMDKLELRRISRARASGPERFRQLAATSPDGIICTDQRGIITFWNDTASRLFGQTADQAAGRPIDDVLPGEGQRAIRIAEEATGHSEYLWVGKTAERLGQMRNGSACLIELSAARWREGGADSFGYIVREVKNRRSHEERTFNRAHFDPLTGLPNRGVLRLRLTEAARSSIPISVVAVGVDGFRNVNETMGHGVGDALLQAVSTRLLDAVRPVDTVVRMGGDEFALLLPGVTDEETASATAVAAIRAISAPFTLSGLGVHVSASAGIAMWPTPGGSLEEVVSNANLALYQAKDEGRRCYRIFRPALRSAAVQRRAYSGELAQAFENKEFELYYQPQVRLRDGAIVGAEALLRWRHPTRGVLAPCDFLSSLETDRLVSEVGSWILEEACVQAARWREPFPEFRMSINLFGAQFRNGDLAGEVLKILARTFLPPKALELEITENIILRADASMIDPLRALQAEGIGIVLDDYGTGYASLSLLKSYPLTRLKIDRSFVDGVGRSSLDTSIVQAVLQLGSGFGLSVTAEGVETERQLETLRSMGCAEAQGFLLGKPTPAGEWGAHLDRADAGRVMQEDEKGRTSGAGAASA